MSHAKVTKNTEKVIEKEYNERLERCVPVAKKINALIAAHADTIVLGESQESMDSIDPIAKEVLQLFLDENMMWSDRQFIMQLATQPIVYLADTVNEALNKSWDKAVEKRFGKAYIDLTMQEVDAALREAVV